MPASSSREKVRRHRANLRAKGMRPITIWVPDTRSPAFKEEARRQARLVSQGPEFEEDMSWIERVSAFDNEDRGDEG